MLGRRSDVGLVQEQIDALSERVRVARLEERIDALAVLVDSRFGSFSELMDSRFVTLRTVVDGQAEKVKLALDAADKAVTKAEISVNDRLSAMNEFRGALSDQAMNNVARTEFDQFRRQYSEAHALLRDAFGTQIAELKERIDKAEGRSGGVSGAWGVIVAVAGIAVAIGALLFRNL